MSPQRERLPSQAGHPSGLGGHRQHTSDVTRILGLAGGLFGLIATRAAIPAVLALSPNHLAGAGDVAAAARLPFVDRDSVRGLTPDRPLRGLRKFVRSAQPRHELPVDLCWSGEPDFHVPAIRGRRLAFLDPRATDVACGFQREDKPPAFRWTRSRQ
jgi:hypothetical protein